MRRVSWGDGALTIATVTERMRLLTTVNYFAKMWVVKHDTWILSPAVWTWASFFIMYLEIFRQLRWVRITSWAGLITSTVLHLVYAIWAFAIANPQNGPYFIHAGGIIGMPMAAIGVLVDVWIFVIPVWAIAGLNMKAGKKWKVVILFTGGAIGVVGSVATLFFRVASNQMTGRWSGVPAFICTACEMYVGVICACLPAASYAAKNKNSIYHAVCRESLSLVSITHQRSRKTGESSGTFSQTKTNGGLRSTDRKYAPYYELDDANMTASLVSESHGESKCGIDGGAELVILKHVQIEVKSGRPATAVKEG